MAESWREACWKAERELEEYKGTIVPALVDRVKRLEKVEVLLREQMEHSDRQSMVMGKMHDEVCFLRRFIHDNGLDFKMTQAWTEERLRIAGERSGTDRE